MALLGWTCISFRTWPFKRIAKKSLWALLKTLKMSYLLKAEFLSAPKANRFSFPPVGPLHRLNETDIAKPLTSLLRAAE